LHFWGGLEPIGERAEALGLRRHGIGEGAQVRHPARSCHEDIGSRLEGGLSRLADAGGRSFRRHRSSSPRLLPEALPVT
jgi:hypothetical protein